MNDNTNLLISRLLDQAKRVANDTDAIRLREAAAHIELLQRRLEVEQRENTKLSLELGEAYEKIDKLSAGAEAEATS